MNTTFKKLILGFFLFTNYGAEAQQWTQKGLDIDGVTAQDRFGSAVSLSSDGNTFAAGAPSSGSVGGIPGITCVFDWNAVTSSWEQRGAEINGDNNGDKFGYSVSLSADGNTLAIGAPQNDNAGLLSGHVRVYEWNAVLNSWTQKGVDINGEAAEDQFGWSVQLSDDGNTLIGGARYNSALGWGTGHSRVFRWNGSIAAWEQMGTDIDGEAAGSGAGFATSINAIGNIIAVASPYHNGNGHVKIYQWNEVTNDWDQLGATIDGDATDFIFGLAISLSENGYILAIGSNGSCQTGQDAGHTRIYEWNVGTATWEQIGATINGESAWDLSGYSVSLNGLGTAVALGSPHNDGAGSDSGNTRVFDWDGGTNTWIQRGMEIDGEAANDTFGWSVSLSSDGYTIASGSNMNDANGLDAGHVRVYDSPFLGLTQNEDHALIEIFPNPVQNDLHIQSIDLVEGYTLTDLTGKTISIANINANEFTISTSSLNSGIYYLQLQSNGANYSRKIIKQ